MIQGLNIEETLSSEVTEQFQSGQNYGGPVSNEFGYWFGFLLAYMAAQQCNKGANQYS